MFEGAPASVAGWVARTLAAHFALLHVLPTDFCAQSYARQAGCLNERAICRVPLASEEAHGIGPLNHNHFDEVTLCRGCNLTYPKPQINNLKLLY